jgi:hypothetical protein
MVRSSLCTAIDVPMSMYTASYCDSDQKVVSTDELSSETIHKDVCTLITYLDFATIPQLYYRVFEMLKSVSNSCLQAVTVEIAASPLPQQVHIIKDR